jgi:hypothetical protein
VRTDIYIHGVRDNEYETTFKKNEEGAERTRLRQIRRRVQELEGKKKLSASEKDAKHPPHVEAARATLNSEERVAGKKLKEVREKLLSQTNSESKMGLTPDIMKNNPEFIAAKSEYERAFQALRNFNSKYRP